MFRWISNWWKQKQHKSGKVSDGSKPNEGPYEHPPTIIRADHTGAAEAEYRKHDRQYKDRQISTNLLIALFTAVTAGVGIWQGFLTRQALRTAQENNAIASLQIWRAIDNMNWMARSMNQSAREAQTATEITTKNFRQDLRPYIFVEDLKPNVIIFEPGKQAEWNIQFVNYGKSPSVREAFEGYVWPGASAERDVDRFFEHLPRNKYGALQTPPNANSGPPTSKGLSYTTIQSKSPLTVDQVVYGKTYDVGAILAVRVWYCDVFGGAHYTDFCEATLTTGAVTACPKHNEIH